MKACMRCGVCCRKGGPALRRSEQDILEFLPLKDLVCLRPGEPAFDPRRGTVRPLAAELIKIRGKGNSWECLYYGDGCGIYARRPLECQALSCKRSESLFAVMEAPALTRADFIRQDSALGECIAEHEARFPVAQCMGLLETSAAGIPDELDEMLRAELAFRYALAAAVGAGDQDLWAYLGRPLWRVLRPLRPGLAGYENTGDIASNC